MPADAARVERALRNAIAQGDMEAARAIAQGYRQQQQAAATVVERPGPSTGERVARFVGGTAGSLAGTPAGFPGMLAGGAIGAPAAGEAWRWAAQQPELQAPLTPAEQINPIGAYGMRLGRAIRSDAVVPGSPAPRTGGEVLEDVTGAAIEGGLGGATGAVGGRALGVADDALRTLGRGLRTRPEAQVAANQYRSAQQAAGVTEAPGTFSTVARELGVMGGYGGAAEVMTGGLTGGGAAIVGAMMRLPAATAKLLANNPRFTRWALNSGPTAASTAAGAAAGQGAVQTGVFTADQVDGLMQLMVDEGPEVASAVRQLMRETQTMAREQMR